MRMTALALVVAAASPVSAFDFDADGNDDQLINTCVADASGTLPEDCMVSIVLANGHRMDVIPGETVDYGVTRTMTGQADGNRTEGQPILRIDEISFGVGQNGVYPALDAITTSMLSRVPVHGMDVMSANEMGLEWSVTDAELVTFSGMLPGLGNVRVVVVAHPLFGSASPWVMTGQARKVLASGRSLDFPRIYPGQNRVTIIDARLDGMLVYRIPTEES